MVTDTAFALAALGLQPKQCTAIFASNSHLWVAADFATISNGAISVPIYPTSSLSDIEYILSNSQAKVAFVQNDRLLKKVLSEGTTSRTGKDCRIFVACPQPVRKRSA